VDARFGLFEEIANLQQDRCTVCAERSLELEIVLDTPDGSPM
jgi:hypothetical protein